MSRSRRAAAMIVLAALATAAPARAYDFSVHTRIIAQAYDLRSIRLYGPDVWLGRGRHTQTLPLHVAVEAFGGLRVRDASPLGSYQVELDGTTGADCREYVEGVYGAGLGHGAWKIIDRTAGLTDHPRADDTGYCPQRDELMPTY